MVAFLAVFAAILVAVGGYLSIGGAPENDIVDCPDSIDAQVGEEFTVPLEGNVTTGYDWKFVSGEGVELVSDWYVSHDAGDPPRCGVGGTHYFKFKCAEKGTYELTFDYLRSWEGSEGNLKVVQITVS